MGRWIFGIAPQAGPGVHRRRIGGGGGLGLRPGNDGGPVAQGKPDRRGHFDVHVWRRTPIWPPRPCRGPRFRGQEYGPIRWRTGSGRPILTEPAWQKNVRQTLRIAPHALDSPQQHRGPWQPHLGDRALLSRLSHNLALVPPPSNPDRGETSGIPSRQTPGGRGGHRQSKDEILAPGRQARANNCHAPSESDCQPRAKIRKKSPSVERWLGESRVSRPGSQRACRFPVFKFRIALP
jgi:hypothetical protein